MLSLSAVGVTLLLDRVPGKRESRLARDLLAAATGRWDLEPALRPFEWPPATPVPAAAGSDSAARALRAFVDKQLSDHASTLLILTEGVAARLGEFARPPGCIVIRDFAALAREPAEKRRVWASLGQHRLAPAGRQPVAGRAAAGDAGSAGYPAAASNEPGTTSAATDPEAPA